MQCVRRSFLLSILAGCLFLTPSCKLIQGNSRVAKINNPSIYLKDTSFALAPLPYRPSVPRMLDLLHTRLELEIDWRQQAVEGTATLSLRPFLYDTDSFIIDAKSMSILESSLWIDGDSIPLQTSYDGNKLTCKANRIFKEKDTLDLVIRYRSNNRNYAVPNLSREDKGMYFIDPLDTLDYLPRQLWTQGETSNSSRWFPTLDQPNERCTQELLITVDSQFTTLSNGQLVYSTYKPEGRRTDYWLQSKPHAPYLCVLVVGEFRVVKDKLDDLEISYYVEPEYESSAKAVFGRTPDMINYFSKLLDEPYPWDKYAQVAVRRFVSGAMENTSASVFMEELQQTEREQIDQNWDFIIAHELFHQWFGNLLTCESWGQLTLNEAFANYSEYLWMENTEGKDASDYNALMQLNLYLSEARSKKVEIVRNRYSDEAGLFDNHTYAKGGQNLRYLRHLLGDTAFFRSLRLYIDRHKFSSVELSDLRKSFEEVSGLDLSHFFKTWFESPGHPVIRLSHEVSDTSGLWIIYEQAQRAEGDLIFEFHLPVFIRQDGRVTEHRLWIEKAAGKIHLPNFTQPDWIYADPDRIVPGEIIQDFSTEQLASLQTKLPLLGVRYDLLRRLSHANPSPLYYDILMKAVKDPFWAVREKGVELLASFKEKEFKGTDFLLTQLAFSDPKSAVRVAALAAIPERSKELAVQTARKLISDSSYSVLSKALEILFESKVPESPLLAARFEKEKNSQVVMVLAGYYATAGIEGKFDWFKAKIVRSPDSYQQFVLLNEIGKYVAAHDPKHKQDCINFLKTWGESGHEPFTKLAVFQSLQLFKQEPGVEEALKELVSREKNAGSQAVFRMFE